MARSKALEVCNVFSWENKRDDKRVDKILEKFQIYMYWTYPFE